MKSDAESLKSGSAGIAIDLLRGFLALMVLLAHALESGLLVVEGAKLPSWMAVTLGHGGFWVNGFFVLSGFCIHRAVMALRERRGAFAGPYLRARLTRLYPMYFVALALALIITPWPGGGSFISHLLMMQGITGPLPAIKPAWSLTYEVVYYAAWPLSLVACGWSPRRALILGGGGTLILSVALMLVWKKGTGGADDTWVLPLALIAANFPLWLAGAWLAERWADAIRASSGWLASAALAWVIMGYLLHAWLLHCGASTTVIVLLSWLVVPGWLGLILGSAGVEALGRWRRLAGWLGLLSYPLYLLHQPLLDMMVKFGRSLNLSPSLAEAVLLLCAGVMIFMLAAGVPLEAALLKWRSGHLARLKGRELKTASA